jgi:hypothetical protein
MQRRGRGRGDPDQVGRAVDVEALDDLVGVVEVVPARGQGRDPRSRRESGDSAVMMRWIRIRS